MILAQIPDLALPERIPKHVRAAAKCLDVYTDSEDVPFDATCWIACKHAWPHADPSWSDCYFLTLSIQSEHSIGDFEHSRTQYVPRGTLFVIDPRVKHWLEPFPNDTDNKSGWIGVQWEVKRRNAKAKVREIVAALNGEWTVHQDVNKYESWAICADS